MPTVKAVLARARAQLADTETPSLDARLLLQHVTGLSHADVVAEPERWIDDELAERFAALVLRRQDFEPVTRILGRREFYGREFIVTSDVLDPRADTETIIEVCLGLMSEDRGYRILDLGTGSGILAITLLAERNKTTGVAVDISERALEVAKSNADMILSDERVQFLRSHWFGRVEGQFDLIVSNPPYIPAAEVPLLDVEVRDHDPHLALVGGEDGLACYREIALGADAFLNAGGFVAVEIGAGQATEVTRIFETAGFALTEQREDLGGHIRCLAFRRTVQVA